MNDFPPDPTDVPEALGAPTSSYRRHAALAAAGLGLFVGTYLGFITWWVWVVWRLHQSEDPVLATLLSVPAGLLIYTLVSGLFARSASAHREDVEITPEDQPRLFALVHHIADKAGAPRPHRVFVAPDVNAAVFYDASFWNLVFPTKKNLRIGLGLVNALSLDEFKAVLAHEFGHFSQRSTGIGQYLYTAWSIIGHTVHARTWIDRLIGFLSSVDIRIAWVGWLLGLLVWSMRSILELVFRGVLALERALSREQEFNADRVAVRLSGSDAIVHALKKLGAADDAFGRAAGFGLGQATDGRVPNDLYAVQTRMLDHLRQIRSEPDYGRTPPPSAPEHRVFEHELGLPPRMWLTHPPNREREENAKAVYVPSPRDERSAWTIFDDPRALRTRVTKEVFARLERVGAPIPDDELLAKLDEAFDRPENRPEYRGVYVGRSSVRAHQRVEALIGPPPADLRAAIASLYPESLVGLLVGWREKQDERSRLKALVEGVLEAPGGVVVFRGRKIGKADLRLALDEVERDLAADTAALEEHDRAVRTAHRAAAAAVGRGWEDHLAGLLALVHHLEHRLADLLDAKGHLDHVLQVVTADGRVSNAEMNALVAAGSEVQSALEGLEAARPEVRLPEEIRRSFGGKDFDQVLGQRLGLPSPHADNLAEWIQHVTGWVQARSQLLEAVGDRALGALLEAEAKVAAAYLDGVDPGDAPGGAAVPAVYPTLTPGAERARSAKLSLWDRFITADGWVAATARFSVAAAILGLAAVATLSGMSTAQVWVYNGLGTTVRVTLGEADPVLLAPGQQARLDLDFEEVTLRAVRAADDAEIEVFRSELRRRQVYNVGRGAGLLRTYATYGTAEQVEPTPLGAPRWYAPIEAYVFEAAPERVSTRSGGASRSVLEAQAYPGLVFQDSLTEGEAVARAHVAWDDFDAPQLFDWYSAARQAGVDLTPELLSRARAASGVLAGRWVQDLLTGEERAAWCEALRARAAQAPGDADLGYLATRCLEEDRAQNEAAIALFEAHPEHRWARYGAFFAYADRGAWERSLALYGQIKMTGQLQANLDDIAYRVRRLTRIRADEALPEAPATQSWLALVLAGVEAGTIPSVGIPDLAGWEKLARGEIAAIGIADQPLLVRLVAASEGATEEQRAAARALAETEGLNPQSALVAIATARRDGTPVSPAWEDALRAGWPAAAAALAREPGDLAETDLRVRAAMRVVEVILAGDAAPREARQEARALSLVGERPYFHP